MNEDSLRNIQGENNFWKTEQHSEIKTCQSTRKECTWQLIGDMKPKQIGLNWII